MRVPDYWQKIGYRPRYCQNEVLAMNLWTVWNHHKICFS